MSKKFKYKNHIIEVEDCDNVSSKEIKKRVISIAKKLDDAENKFKLYVIFDDSKNENFYGQYATLNEAVNAAEKDDAIVSYEVKKDGESLKKVTKASAKDEEYKYEVLWYDEENSTGDPHTQEFTSRAEAMKFYNTHKKDTDKFDWWVTKRDADWNIVEDIIY